MALLGARSDRVAVTDLGSGPRETCEQLLTALNNDFSRMVRFRRNNPRAALGGADNAWVCTTDDTLHVTILHVQFCDAALATEEARMFDGTIAFCRDTWTLSVPLASASRVGGIMGAIRAAVILVVLAVLAVALLSPQMAWVLARRFGAWLLTQLPVRK